MKAEPFLKNLWSAELVLDEIGTKSQVYPCENVFMAFNVSEAQERLRLFKSYGNDISQSEASIEMLTKNFDNYISTIEKEYGYQTTEAEFDVIEFLEATSMSVVQFAQKYDKDYLCWPREHRVSLWQGLLHYHRYKFFEEYMGEIPGGIDLFLRIIPVVEEPIDRAMFSGSFYWRQRDVKFLHDYQAARFELEGRLDEEEFGSQK